MAPAESEGDGTGAGLAALRHGGTEIQQECRETEEDIPAFVQSLCDRLDSGGYSKLRSATTGSRDTQLAKNSPAQKAKEPAAESNLPRDMPSVLTQPVGGGPIPQRSCFVAASGADAEGKLTLRSGTASETKSEQVEDEASMD